MIDEQVYCLLGPLDGAYLPYTHEIIKWKPQIAIRRKTKLEIMHVYRYYDGVYIYQGQFDEAKKSKM